MSEKRIFRIPFHAMASTCELVIAAKDEEDAQRAYDVAFSEISRIEKKYSRYLPDSVIAKINAQAGLEPQECDEETWSLLDFADQLYMLSEGAFDITSGVLRRAWNFQNPQLPASNLLHELTKLVEWKQVQREQGHVFLPRRGMEIDFGGFGKEYAADRAGVLLISMGFRHGYINLAGDIRVLGPKVDSSPWLIGIRHPRQEKKLIATIPIDQGGIATSGDYERYFEIQGQRYCHILNPKSGMPVKHWSSVSVQAPLCVAAGCASTIAMLKEAKGLDYLESTGYAYLVTDSKGQMFFSKPPKTI